MIKFKVLNIIIRKEIPRYIKFYLAKKDPCQIALDPQQCFYQCYWNLGNENRMACFPFLNYSMNWERGRVAEDV